MKVVALSVGKPKQVEYKGKPLETGIYKLPVERAAQLGPEGFSGDGQADLVNHGGPDKAVCVYPEEHYPYWEQELGKPVGVSAFGENLTTSGLLETDVCIGDVFEIGTAVVQVSQPRYPCFKLSQKHGAADMPAKVLKTGYCGFYFRVLKTGEISAGTPIVRVSRGAGSVPVSRVLAVMAAGKQDREGMLQLVGHPDLSASVRESFRKRLGEL